MGNGNSRSVTNNSVTNCDEDGNCERVATSCVDGDCTETRTPIEADETLDEGDEGDEGDEVDETVEGGEDEILDTDEVYAIEDSEEVDEKKTFPMGLIIFLIVLVVLFFVGVLYVVYKNKSKIPKITRNLPLKNPNLNKV